MKRAAHSGRPGRRRQRGVAAVELALILSLLLLLLPFPLICGRAFWHYAVLQKAAHDAARFMSALPLRDIQDATRAASASAQAAAMIAAATAELNSQGPQISVFCNITACIGGAAPATIHVVASIQLLDSVFGSITSYITGDYGLKVEADVTMRYVGL